MERLAEVFVLQIQPDFIEQAGQILAVQIGVDAQKCCFENLWKNTAALIATRLLQ